MPQRKNKCWADLRLSAKKSGAAPTHAAGRKAEPLSLRAKQALLKSGKCPPVSPLLRSSARLPQCCPLTGEGRRVTARKSGAGFSRRARNRFSLQNGPHPPLPTGPSPRAANRNPSPNPNRIRCLKSPRRQHHPNQALRPHPLPPNRLPAPNPPPPQDNRHNRHNRPRTNPRRSQPLQRLPANRIKPQSWWKNPGSIPSRTISPVHFSDG